MTTVALSNPILLRLVTFLFTFLHRIIGSQFQRVFNFAHSFYSNWLEIPYYNQEEQVFSADFVKYHSILSYEEPKCYKIPVSGKEYQLPSDVSVWRRADLRNLPEVSKRESISEKSDNHLWLKIKQIAHSGSVSETDTSSPQAKASSSPCAEPKRKSYMSSTLLKLEDYNRINREYFYKKYHSGIQLDEYSFTHPSAKPIYVRNLLVPSAYVWKSFKANKSLKRKAPAFKPTELSTIFENLAY